MYLHVGEDTLVRCSEIIAILDKESASSSPYLEEFLHSHEVVTLSKAGYKSIVVTCNKVYYSPLASGTLKKRSKKISAQEF
ncbi:extracellular matrix regulator RemB [Bacillus massilinigeriensis]|uniref:extracellular matrix regulator RemB n=1 Tax=Bacillus mediterraneensis TaxID=1805474 RepID=UPI0008F89F8B|nr:extracellular matrix/biofilm biosynthesis regulator RemA family protein [Bacillus mediterraneensis]